MLKKIKNKEWVLENFNPFLTSDSSCDNTIDYDTISFSDCDTPSWLGDNSSTDDDGTWIPGSGYNIGAFYINGKPLTSWGAQFGGRANDDKKQMLKTYYNVAAQIKIRFPDGFGAYINSFKNNIETFDVTKLKIMEMIPNNIGIGFSVHIQFVLNEIEIWGKFINVGIDKNPIFICEDISKYSIENKLKVTGKLWNMILDWFKVKPGFYQCVAKQIFVFNDFGQIKEIVENNIVEVLHSDEDRIKLKFDDKIMYVKNPVYYWFNWFFIKK